MYVKKIRAAGLVAAAAAAAALFSAAPASAGNAGVLNNDLVDLLAWQVCGSNAALVGAQVPLVSPTRAKNCVNGSNQTVTARYQHGGNAGILNHDVVDALPWQICGSEVPILGVQLSAISPARADNCLNGLNSLH